MNGAPDWQDGECCFRCRTQFTLVARKHHCRNCGNIFCAKCSSQQIPIPKLNIEKNVRVCDGCFEKISSKNESDPLVLASIKSPEQDESKIKTNSKSSGSSSKSSNSSNKPAANASAPSEQELKEEEELQLALALSLSEAPAKVSFPDCKQFEEPNGSNLSTPAKNNIEKPSTSSNSLVKNQPIMTNDNNSTSNLNGAPSQLVMQQQQQQAPQYVSTPEKQQPQTQAPTQIQAQYSLDQQMPYRDQMLFRFVAEVQSTSDIFTNRVNSCKLRNRPIADDTAIQTLFLKLTSMHAKLLEYIKTHDEERADYESLQDKLSQISDARAALDALREEHQEKVRQEAAEAERQRQSQLALKLEMMRQKKSQMMQYQREVALQRIQQQEMMLRQPQGYQQPPPTMAQQLQQSAPVPGPSEIPTHTSEAINQQQTTPHQLEQVSQISQPVTQASSLHQQIFQPQVHHLPQQQQYLPPGPKVEDEAPLISFDD